MNGSRDRRRKKVEPQVGMTYLEAMAHVQNGGKARRPHWHPHSFIFFDPALMGDRKIWCDHRPYYPDMRHRAVRGYLSCDGDRTANDWLKYEEPNDGKSAAGV